MVLGRTRVDDPTTDGGTTAAATAPQASELAECGLFDAYLSTNRTCEIGLERATGEPYEVEYRLRHRTGEYRWTLGRALPIRDGGGAITLMTLHAAARIDRGDGDARTDVRRIAATLSSGRVPDDVGRHAGLAGRRQLGRHLQAQRGQGQFKGATRAAGRRLNPATTYRVRRGPGGTVDLLSRAHVRARMSRERA